jgi:hypothetical protein
MNWSSAILAASGAFLIGSVAIAQGGGPAPATNLQVYPKDMPRAEIMTIMKGFSTALGVKCTHCHVGTPPNMDFASDAKKEKLTARAMLRMVHRINREDFGVTEFKDVKVTCFTCHRGSTKPLVRPPAPAAEKTAPPERG